MQNSSTFNHPAAARAITMLGLLLATGLVLGAFVLGLQTKNIGAGRSTIAVKGLAEKSIKADLAEWEISAFAKSASLPETLRQLRKERKDLDQFLAARGFDASSVVDRGETINANFEERELGNRVVRVQDGFVGNQTVVIRSRELEKITAASKAILDYQAQGQSVRHQSPSYLVSNLEEIKLSLIGAATQNATKRGEEFARYGKSELGRLRSASQGAFYILADSANALSDDYGGTYDKTTVNKVARVVVSLEYDLK
ncbi:MAG: SIMPL domain-containing protein [Rhizobacter sp.]